MTLSELAAKIEGLDGPDREVDARIAVALSIGARGLLPDDHEYLSLVRKDDGCAPGAYWFKCRSGASLRTALEYTKSLDAALTLVPEGWGVLMAWNPKGNCKCDLSNGAMDGRDRLWIGSEPCATPALALCSASLRAQSHSLGSPSA